MSKGEPIKLTITGNTPSFKNCKRAILDRNTGKMRTLTEGKTKRRMEEIIASFVSQLLLVTQTIEPATCLEHSKLFATVLLLPEDDSWLWISDIRITGQSVPKGMEGATIVIEQL